MRRLLMIGIFLMNVIAVMALGKSPLSDSLSLNVSSPVPQSSDTVIIAPKKHREISKFRRIIRGFSYIDTNYVEPQHYNWAVMLQATHAYDIYTLRTTSGAKQSMTFSPSGNIKVGPYFGWRWVFLGYTFDLKNIGLGGKTPKQELDFSIYSAQIGVDLFYRRTGSDYKIRDVSVWQRSGHNPLEGRSFDGLSVGITGFNLYYIFNHKRFSYPAAFAQSTCQKLNCGSWLAGIGYTRNSLSFDYEKLQGMIEKYSDSPTARLDSALMFKAVKYLDVNVSGGYAYNWVFAKHCLFCASLSMALAYKKSKGTTDDEEIRGFNVKNINVDGIGRFGLVYNNTRWYAGASAIIHSYNYRKSNFSATNVFGSINAYVGYNFGQRARYKKK